MPTKPAPIKKAAAPKKKEEAAAVPEAAPAPVEEAPAEAAPAEAAPAEAAPAEAAPAPAEGEAPPAEGDAPAAPPAEEPKAPSPPPPPPAEPTSAPVDLFVEDKNNTSVTIMWSEPATVGHTGLDGYTIEICKDGTEDWKAANDHLQVSCLYVIKNQVTGDRLKIRVVAVNAGGRSPAVCLPEAVLVMEVANRPKVHVPRNLRQRYVTKAGAKINLTIPFTGKPKPVISWTKDGQPLDTKRVQTRSTDLNSILFLRAAARDDSGVYEMTVKVEDFEDKASIILQIIELPGPPATITIADTWGFNVSLEWTPPKDCGNTDITAYTVQKADNKTGIWFTVGEHYHRCSATVPDLVMGNTYKFRVFSENKRGLSEDAIVTKEEAKITKTGIVYNAPEYKDHDFSQAPKFTAALVNQATTLGYNTKLYCAVRGSPRPKIEWIKNACVIAENPKFKQVCVEGICCLEIRKPSNFDSGMYTCKATNGNGTDTVSCKLEIKAAVDPNAAAAAAAAAAAE